MAMPTIYEDTSATHGTGALSVPWGTHNDTFCAVLVVTCAGGDTLGTPTQSGSDGTWTLIASCAAGTGAGSIQIAAYWCRATSGSMSNVTVPDAGDHTSAKMFMIQNVVSSGNPINMYDTQTVTTATASISFAAPNTTVNNCLVFCLAGCGFDQTTSPGGSGWANSGLDTIGFAGQYCTNNGTGGGYMGGVGEKATAGTCGTFSHTWASGSTKQANIIFAISDTATQTGSVGSAAGTSTPTATGASVAAAAGSAAGTSTAAAVGVDGNVGSAAGTSAAAGVGNAIAAGAGSAAGTSSASASSVEHRILDVGTSFPQTFANGTWSVGAFEAKWKVMITMTNASGHASYSGYHGIITSGTASGYGLWLNGSNFEVVDTNDNILGSYACTWSAGQNITLMPDFVGGTLTISGATTGNGVQTFTPSAPHWESGSALYIGGWAGNATWNLAATIGDIYAVVTAGQGSAAGTSTPTATGRATVAGAGSAAGTSTAAAVGEEQNLDFELGAVGSARQLFGAAATSATATLTTQTAGSAFIVCTGGNLTDLATAPTDNKGNTYTALGSAEEFAAWPGYGIRMWACVNATGGSNHQFTQTMTIFDEVSIVVVEITDSEWVEDDAIVERASATSHTSPSVTSLAESHWILFWCSAQTTGSTCVVTPNNGQTVIDDDTAVDHPNGYVPIIATHAYKADAGSYTSTATMTPTAGVIIGAVAVQRAHIASGAGSAAGTSTAAATSTSTATAAGSAAGTSTPTAVGASTAAADGAASGSSSVVGAGSSVVAGVGSAAGTSTPTGAGASTANAAGSAAGTSTPTGTGAATAAAPGSAAGTSTPTAAGRATAAGAGSAGGTGDAAGTGAATVAGAGSAGGAGDAQGASTAITAAAGAASGSGDAAGAGAATVAAAGSAAGSGSASGTPPGTTDAAGSAAGTADATAAGTAIHQGVGAASGSGSGAAVGTALTPAVGGAAGTSTAAAEGSSPSAGAGSAAGSSTATAEGVALSQGAGASSGLGSAAATGAAAAAATGTAAGSSTAQGITPSLADLPTTIRVRLRITTLRIRVKSSTLRVRLKE